MTAVARLVVAAPASGRGNTAAADAVRTACTERGLRVAAFAVGPPGHPPAPVRPLDAWLVGERMLAPLFSHGSAGADIAVVQAGAGLYDGVAGHGDLGSAAQAARLLRAPVLLVLPAGGQGRSVAATAHGFRSFAPDLWIAGALLTGVASASHEAVLKDALAEIELPVLGVLGAGRPGADGIDIDRLLALASSAPALSVEPWSPQEALAEKTESTPPVRIAVLGGAAFVAAYVENLELLTAAGAEVVTVDPLTDLALPEHTAGLYVPDGVPEDHAADLAANLTLRAEIATLARSGAPVVAEGAGLAYLGRSLCGNTMCGIVPADFDLTERSVYGYRVAESLTDGLLTEAGEPAPAYERHRTSATPASGPSRLWRVGDRTEGFGGARLHASYLQTHWAGRPWFARRFVRAAAEPVSGVPSPLG